MASLYFVSRACPLLPPLTPPASLQGYQHVPARRRSCPHRHRSRCLPGAAFRVPAHSLDLHRQRLCRGMPPRCGVGRRRSEDAGICRRRPAPHARAPCRRRPRAQGRGQARAVLRPLRRAAGRSADPLGDAALRAAHGDAAGRTQGDRRARRLRRQGPAHDLRRGVPRLEGRDGFAARGHHHADRGRGGGRLQEPAGIRRRASRRPCRRGRARLRHRHVGQRHPADHQFPARHRLRGTHRALRRSRPALRVVRRCGGQPDPGAGAHHRRPSRCRRPHHARGLL